VSPSTVCAAQHRPAISAHRLIGNGRSALLLRPDAEIDWWCAPELDSPPVCWSLLDVRGGRAAFRDVRYARCSAEPAGPTARTELATPCGRVEVRDGLIDEGAAGVTLVRLVRAVTPERGVERLAGLDVQHELRLTAFGSDPGPDRWKVEPGGASVALGDRWVSVAGGECDAGQDDTLRTRLAVPADGWTALVIRIGPSGTATAEVDVERLVAALDDADADEAALLSSSRPPSVHRERALDSLRVLRACTYAATGAAVASPTLGLPEAPGHDRQFDYRYCWLRDASLAVAVASLLGRRDDAARYLSFVRSITAERLVPAGPVVDIRGETVPDEHEQPGIAGWAGSTPIRVGNAAKDQVQYDGLGLFAEAVSVHVQTGGRLDADTWRLVRELADGIAAQDSGEPLASHGIWEQRESALFVDGDIGRWLVLDRAIKLGRWLRPWQSRRRWTDVRDAIAARVRAAVGADGLLPQVYGQQPPLPDAAALMAVVFGLLGPDEECARRLVRRTIDALDAYPFLYRYPPDGDDGFAGREGAFLPVSFWAVSAQALTGDFSGSTARLDALCSVLPRLLPEEFDPVEHTALGNVPLVWTHAELARSLYVLDAARRQRRWGRLGLWTWRVARYLNLRLRG